MKAPPALATEGRANTDVTIAERAEALATRLGTRGTHDNTVRVYHRTPIDCMHCGKRYLSKERQARHGYCSEECKYNATHRGPITCAICGRKFEGSSSTSKICSRECRLAHNRVKDRRRRAKRREQARA